MERPLKEPIMKMETMVFLLIITSFNGEHVWFDLNYEGSDTNQLIWNFLSQYDLNGLRE